MLTEFLAAANHDDKYTSDPLWLLIWLVCLVAIGGLVVAVAGALRARRPPPSPSGLPFAGSMPAAGVGGLPGPVLFEKTPAFAAPGGSGSAASEVRWLRARLALSVLGVVFVWLLLWIVIMSFTQEATCNPEVGGLLSRAQHGFTRAYCGIDNASAVGVGLDWLLVAALPLCGLALGIAAVTLRRGRPLPFLCAGAAAVTGPMLLAWLLAGAH